jgi:hypothetical protein
MNKKNYTLIVGGHYSLSNDTDADIQSDYSPGIWAIKSQKEIIRYAREILANGDKITVSDYKNARYHSIANKIIKELGIDQPLFKEPEAAPQSVVSNDKPASLAALKKYLVIGRKVHVINYDGEGKRRNEQDTSVMDVQNNSVIFEKTLGVGVKSWLEYGKAEGWTFDDNGATLYFISKDGKVMPCTRIEYQ